MPPKAIPEYGPFLVFEGVEGAGKTTQASLLAEWLELCGKKFTISREPGGTEVGEAIRHVVQNRPDIEVPRKTELLLYLAARAAFVRDVVRPVLERGELFIADRFSMSTYAYQGYGRGLELNEVYRLDRFATDGLVPDLYLVLDLSVETGRDRQKASDKNNDRLELSGDEFLEAVRSGYHELVNSDDRAHLIDANGTIDEVHNRVKNLLRREMPATFALLGD
tara:strand:+ start:2677 stop:3342 length:666 start_codon:yes stop_codon:yes gene_type:complete